MFTRRRWMLSVASLPMSALAAASPETLLREGGAGLVVAMRHAQAPGTFDPPGFRLGECGTQRNLDDVGRAQARAVGAWYRERGLQPSAVRSSAWCRCLDTARLAFGAAQPWEPLNSIIGATSDKTAAVAAMTTELARLAAAGAPGFQVWVTHQVNISALAGGFANSGEAVLVRHDARRAAVEVLGTLSIA